MYSAVSIASFIITDTEVKCDLYFVMIYCNVTTWILTALSQDYFRRKHYYLKLRGCVTFYKEVQPYIILTFFVASVGKFTVNKVFYPPTWVLKIYYPGCCRY